MSLSEQYTFCRSQLELDLLIESDNLNWYHGDLADAAIGTHQFVMLQGKGRKEWKLREE